MLHYTGMLKFTAEEFCPKYSERTLTEIPHKKRWPNYSKIALIEILQKNSDQITSKLLWLIYSKKTLPKLLRKYSAWYTQKWLRQTYTRSSLTDMIHISQLILRKNNIRNTPIGQCCVSQQKVTVLFLTSKLYLSRKLTPPYFQSASLFPHKRKHEAQWTD